MTRQVTRRMNTLLKGIIVTVATIFGFALIAAGVGIAASPSADTSAVAERDNVVAKRDDDSAPVLAVAQDDDNDDGVGDDNGGQTRTRTRTGHQANAQAGVADDDGVADDNGGQTRTRTGHRGGDDHGNSGPGGGDDHSRDFSRDLTNTN